MRRSLADFPLFATCSAPALRSWTEACTFTEFADRKHVLKEGEPARHIFFQLSGVTRVYLTDRNGNEITVKLFRAPAVFGEMECLTRTAFIENVQVMEAALIARIDYASLNKLLDSTPSVMKALLVDVCSRFRVSALNQAFIAFEHAEGRIANILLAYAETFGVQEKDGVRIATRSLTQAAVAQSVGVTSRSVERVFAGWRRAGKISKRQGTYVLHEPDWLRSLSVVESPNFAHSVKTPE